MKTFCMRYLWLQVAAFFVAAGLPAQAAATTILKKKPANTAVKDHVYVVTGGTSGIGLELTQKLLNLHPTIHVIATGRDEKKFPGVHEKLGNTNRLELVPIDVGNAESMKSLAKFIDGKYGYLDGVFNNAGAAGPSDGMPADADFKDVVECLNGHCNQLVFAERYFGPLLKKGVEIRKNDPPDTKKNLPENKQRFTSSVVKHWEIKPGEGPYHFPYKAVFYPPGQSTKYEVFKNIAQTSDADWGGTYGAATQTAFIVQVFGDVAAMWTQIDGVVGVPGPKLREVSSDVKKLLGWQGQKLDDALDRIAKERGLERQLVKRVFEKVSSKAEEMANLRKSKLPKKDFSTAEEVASRMLWAAINGKKGELYSWDGMEVSGTSQVHVGSPPRPSTPVNLKGKTIVITHHPNEQRRANAIASQLRAAGGEVVLKEISAASSTVKLPENLFAAIHVSGQTHISQNPADMKEGEWEAYMQRFMLDPSAVAIGAFGAMVKDGKKDVKNYVDKEGLFINVGPDTGNSNVSKAGKAVAEALGIGMDSAVVSFNTEHQGAKSRIKSRSIRGGTAAEQAMAVLNLFGNEALESDKSIYFLH